MKKVHIVISVILAIVLVGSLLLLGTGLLRFGWVDIPYPDVVSAKITNTLYDGFQFEVSDPHYIEHLTKALDNLGPMFHTPQNHASNGSLYTLRLETADGESHVITVLNENQIAFRYRVYHTDLSEVLPHIETFEEQAWASANQTLSGQLRNALQEGKSEGLAQDLAQGFTQSPKRFIQCLAMEDLAVQESIYELLTVHYKINGTTAVFVHDLLDLFTDEELDANHRNILTLLLLSQEPDLTDASDYLTDALLDSLKYTDGAASDYSSRLLLGFFEQDPAELLEYVAKREDDIQALVLSMLVYAVTGTAEMEQFTGNVESLAKDTTLPEAEAALAGKLAELISSAEK